VKRVLKVIGKNEGKKKDGLFCFLRDLEEIFVFLNLVSNIPVLNEAFTSLMQICGTKQADKFMTIGQ
jgi:hypothetical protein